MSDTFDMDVTEQAFLLTVCKKSGMYEIRTGVWVIVSGDTVYASTSKQGPFKRCVESTS